VHTAEELHALEQQQFDTWQAGLLAWAAGGSDGSSSSNIRAGDTEAREQQQQQQQQMPGSGTARSGGTGRLSFYEGRLEFWRQLWRTVEMSDVVLMIVDARWE
jgi:hypothetical protein